MCGIVGRFNFNPAHRVEQEQLTAMMSVIAHRGPDAGGFYTGEGAGLDIAG
jgi:asparagine synthase (glutamine-hydrolysing)